MYVCECEGGKQDKTKTTKDTKTKQKTKIHWNDYRSSANADKKNGDFTTQI